MIAAIEVNVDAVRANARRIAQLVAPARFAAVIKANAYGHGLVPVARALEKIIDRFCVYRVEEALTLREAGIASPIVILGPVEPRALEEAVRARAALPLWDLGSYCDDVARAARRAARPAAIHLKVNTGLNRLGIEPQDAPAALARLRTLPGIEVAGIWSHLAAAEELDSDYTLRQVEKFERAVSGLGPGPPLKHIAASAAAVLWPQTRFDLVRVGIALYGLAPSPGSDAAMREAGFRLDPVLSWTSSLVAVREVEAGASIGYGRTYVAPEPKKIGIVPIGYAEGLARLASNRGAVLAGGVRCPIVGRVCMNMTFVDVSAVAEPHAGMPVTLIGRDGGATLSAADWARWCETIDYEIVARLPAELPRRIVP